MTEQMNETPLVPLPPWAPEEPNYLILHSMMDMDTSNFSSSTVNLLSLIPPSPLLPDGTNESITKPCPLLKSTPMYITSPSLGSSEPSLPSSLGVTLTELLKGAHSQIRYLDHQIQKLNDKRVVSWYDLPSFLSCLCLSPAPSPDRKSTRLNSSHQIISYAVFCLKKKKSNHNHTHIR